ncbi:hypothetical protein TNCV_1252921 [Trichonephila clavipes]|nr:hypothetical protein TNCV_1252921 [Trichonephila clavipes]
MDHLILNYGQVTRMTPELAPPSPNYHTTPTGGRFRSRQMHRCPTRWVFSGTGLELVTRQVTVRYLYHSATAAPRYTPDFTVYIKWRQWQNCIIIAYPPFLSGRSPTTMQHHLVQRR